ncbi:hypothetical protein ACF0H5_007188 [Mactra antiquata]
MLIYQKNDRVLVIQGISEKTVYVYCEDGFVSYSYHVEDEQNVLYCVSGIGDVSKIGQKQLLHRARSDTGDHSEEPVEIFEDLLRDEINDDNEIELKLSTEPVVVLNKEDVVLESHGNHKIIGVYSSNRSVLLLKSNYVLEVYSNLSASSSIDPLILEIPTASITSRSVYDESQRILVKILTCANTDSVDSIFPDVLRVTESLFRVLFGEEVMLISSTVVLVSLNDDSKTVIYSTLPKEVRKDFPSKLDKENTACWKTLCQLSSDIVGILSVQFEVDTMASEGDDGSGLCVCSKDGNVTVFHCDSSNKSCMISDLVICSPALTVCSYNNRIYHSTGNQVFENKLMYESQTGQQAAKVSMKSTALNVSNVSKLCISTSDEYTQSLDSPCHLHCILLNHEVKTITVPIQDNDHASSTVYKQDSIRDVLKSLEDISQKKDILRKQTNHQMQFIQQLNLAAVLTNFYLKSVSNSKTGSSEPRPFGLNFDVKIGTSLFKFKYFVECELTNRMPLPLSHDWMICGSVYTENDASDCMTVSKNINTAWEPEKKLTLCIPLSSKQYLSGCKLVIKAVLYGDKFASHQTENKEWRTKFAKYGTNLREQSRNVGESRTKLEEGSIKEGLCLSIPVVHEDLDVLHCLIREEKYLELDDTNQPEYYLKQLAKNRTSVADELIKDMPSSSICIMCIIKLPVDEDKSKSADSGALSDFLGNNIIKHMDTSSGSCKLRTVDGTSVHMNMNRLNQSKKGSSDAKTMKTISGCYGNWEIVVRSSPEVTAAIHKAFNRRENSVMKHGKIKEEISVSDAYRGLAKVKDLLNQLEDSSYDTISDRHENISSVFEKLRNIHI